MSGTLFLVATPIGNRRDLSPRGLEVLGQVSILACEDTRHSGRLLAGLGIKAKRLVSLHEHNERHRVAMILEALKNDQDVGIISDAGTPLVSDPGYVVVREAIAEGLSVESIPGPSAVLSALVLSGLAPHPFTFLGFSPPKTGKRTRFFAQYRELGHTLIFFESPHRLVRSLSDALAVFGEDRPAAVARELTKLHEEVLRGPLGELVQLLGDRPRIKGEIVVVIGPEAKKDRKVQRS